MQASSGGHQGNVGVESQGVDWAGPTKCIHLSEGACPVERVRAHSPRPRPRARPQGAGGEHPNEWQAGLQIGIKTLNVNSVRRAKRPEDVLPHCLAHNLRQQNHSHRHRHRIDEARTPLNTVLRGSSDLDTAIELASSVMTELGVKPARMDNIVGIEVVIQCPEGFDHDDFWARCLKWIDGRYEHVVSAVVHRDQVRPHLHVLVLAISAGRLAGNDLSSGPNRIYLQREEFFAFMCVAPQQPLSRRRSKTLAELALSAGRGAKTRRAAEMRDLILDRATGEVWRRPAASNNPSSASRRFESHSQLVGDPLIASSPQPWHQVSINASGMKASQFSEVHSDLTVSESSVDKRFSKQDRVLSALAQVWYARDAVPCKSPVWFPTARLCGASTQSTRAPKSLDQRIRSQLHFLKATMTATRKPSPRPIPPSAATSAVTPPAPLDVAGLVLDPLTTAATSITSAGRKTVGGIDSLAALKTLRSLTEPLQRGDMRYAEAMLAAQATTLNVMFHELLRRADANFGSSLPAADVFMRLALKSQAQSRSTLEALATLKTPTFVAARQVNISHGGDQQVNNGVPAARDVRSRKKSDAIPHNELTSARHELPTYSRAPRRRRRQDSSESSLVVVERT